MKTTVKDWSVDSGYIDESSGNKETYWDYPYTSQRLGYYELLPELKRSVDILAIYTVGKGCSSENLMTQSQLENFNGWGEDTFESIMWNMLVQKKVFGDAFCEIVRDGNRIINLKPLYTGNMKVVTNAKGIITRYEHQVTSKEPTKFKPSDILHICNERLANQIHGTSVVDAVQWTIDAKNEAMDTMRKIQRRALALGVMKVKTNDTNEIATIKAKYQDAVDKGEVLILPDDLADLEQSPPHQTLPLLLDWIKYLDDFSYRALGVPLVLAGGSGGSEGSDKTGFLTFDQVYLKEQRELEADLWNQLAIKVTFNKPASINPEMTLNEEKNTSQTSFIPSETKAKVSRE